jgi:hypothetical protein
MNRRLHPVPPVDSDHLEQGGIASRTEVQPGVVVAIVDADGVMHGVFDIRIGDAVLPSGWMDSELL